MKDTGILMSRPMVHAIAREAEHRGTGKTQTRRGIKLKPGSALALAEHFIANHITAVKGEDGVWRFVVDIPNAHINAPVPLRFSIGQRLWVRETWRADDYDAPATIYQADVPEDALADTKGIIKWKPAIHLPRKRSRFTLEVTNVRVEPLQQCSAADAEAEGVTWESADPPFFYVPGIWPHSLTAVEVTGKGGGAVQCYRKLWNLINGPQAWDANPWVVAVTFTVAKRNIDA